VKTRICTTPKYPSLCGDALRFAFLGFVAGMVFLHRVRADPLRFSLALVDALSGRPQKHPPYIFVHVHGFRTPCHFQLLYKGCSLTSLVTWSWFLWNVGLSDTGLLRAPSFLYSIPQMGRLSRGLGTLFRFNVQYLLVRFLGSYPLCT
jgi:hypothetical protein